VTPQTIGHDDRNTFPPVFGSVLPLRFAKARALCNDDYTVG
jgi:hypothetical protein